MKKALFSKKKIYFSAAIRGKVSTPPGFMLDLVQYMQKNGAIVLSEHVAYENVKERFEIFSKNTAYKITTPIGNEKIVRDVDTAWVDEATHIVAIVDGPSLGVGMEIERALLKPERGLAVTPILCLIQKENLPSLSAMILGVKNKNFYIKTYNNLASAKKRIKDFLL